MKDDQSSSICIVTKPLQYVNVLNIKDLKKKNSILIIVDNFKNSQSLVEFIKWKKEWKHICVFDTLLAAVQYSVKNHMLFSNLYLHTDVSVRLAPLLYMLRKKNVYLYEEGWANYISNLSNKYSLSRFLLCILYGNIHAGLYLGSHPCIKGVYLNFPKLHKKLIPNLKKELSFKESFIDHINKTDFQIFKYAFDKKVFDKEVILYLSSWDMDNKIYGLIKNDQRIKIIKPHPHRKSDETYSSLFDIVVDPGYMAEFVIQDLILKAKSVIIYHQNSTAIIYFQKHPKVTIINISPVREYENFANAAKEEL